MQLVVFDIDGTLTKTVKVDEVCYVRAFAEIFGFESINTRWSDYEHVTDEGITRELLEQRLGRAPDEEELARIRNRFVELLDESFQQHPESIRPIPGARSMLQQMRKESDWTVAIATGAWRATALLKLARAGIDIGDLSAAFCDDHIARHEIVRIAIDRTLSASGEIKFHRTVFVGDGVWDVETSRRLGLAFVGVGEGKDASRLRELGASHVVPDFRDRVAFIEALARARVP